MDDFISTVQERYGRQTSYRGISTLLHRQNAATEPKPDDEQVKKGGFLGLLRPHLQSVSQKLRDEINKLFERRDKLLLQTVSQDMPKIVGRSTERFQSERLKFEKTQTEQSIRLQKRVDLLTSDTGAKLKTVGRELERLSNAEKARAREEKQQAYEQPILARNAQRSTFREIEREREELRREINVDIARTERRITRRLSDEQEYEKRRRG